MTSPSLALALALAREATALARAEADRMAFNATVASYAACLRHSSDNTMRGTKVLFDKEIV